MTDPSQIKQLLSAYLDDEVTDKERSEVEKWLLEAPDLEGRLNDWRELGEGLRSLPRYDLPTDFDQRVLAEIKQRSLVEQPVEQPKSLIEESMDESNQNSQQKRFVKSRSAYPQPSWAGGVRLGIVSVVSMAAGLLLAFLLPPQFQPFYRSQSLSSTRSLNESVRLTFPDAVLAEDSESNDLVDLAIVQIEPGLLSRQVIESGEPTPTPTEPQEMQLGDRSADLLAAKGGRATSLEEEELKPINQIYFVDFQTDDPPLAIVSEIFSKNKIEILSEPVSEIGAEMDTALADQANSKEENTNNSSDLMQLKNLAINRLSQRSNEGVEAVYVIATRNQLDNAMGELAQKANIAGFQLPPDLMSSLLPQNPLKMNYDEELEANYTPMEQIIAQERRGIRSQERDRQGRFFSNEGVARMPSERMENSEQNGWPSSNPETKRIDLGSSLQTGQLSSIHPKSPKPENVNRLPARARQLYPIDSANSVQIDDTKPVPDQAIAAAANSGSDSNSDSMVPSEIRLADESQVTIPLQAADGATDQAGEMIQFLLLIKSKSIPPAKK